MSRPRLSKSERQSLIFANSSNVKTILVCGSRDFNKGSYTKEQVYAKLHELRTGYLDGYSLVIVQGWAEGADLAAAEWAEACFLPFFSFPANWPAWGLDAGHIRNGLMLAIGKPDIVVAFPGGVGTRNMVEQAGEKGIEIIEVTFD